jgi:hypothetical protein
VVNDLIVLIGVCTYQTQEYKKTSGKIPPSKRAPEFDLFPLQDFGWARKMERP